MKAALILVILGCALAFCEASAVQARSSSLLNECDIKEMYLIVQDVYTISLGFKDALYKDVMDTYKDLLKCVAKLEFTTCIEEAASSGVQTVREDTLQYISDVKTYLEAFYQDMQNCMLI